LLAVNKMIIGAAEVGVRVGVGVSGMGVGVGVWVNVGVGGIDVGVEVGWVPQLHTLEAFAKPLYHLIVNGRLDDDPFGCDAALSGVDHA